MPAAVYAKAVKVRYRLMRTDDAGIVLEDLRLLNLGATEHEIPDLGVRGAG